MPAAPTCQPAKGPSPSCALLPGAVACLLRPSPSHLLWIGAGVIAALYAFYVFGELRRLYSRVDVMVEQVAGLHKATQQRLDALDVAFKKQQHQHQQGSCPPRMLDPAALFGLPIFPRSMAAGAGASAAVHVEDDDEDDADVYDEQADDDAVRAMLIAQVERLDGQAGPDVVEEEDEATEAAEEAKQEEDAQADEAGEPAPEPDAEGVPAPDEAALRGMKVEDLRRMLKAKGMDAKGAKDALVARLLQGQAHGVEKNNVAEE